MSRSWPFALDVGAVPLSKLKAAQGKRQEIDMASLLCCLFFSVPIKSAGHWQSLDAIYTNTSVLPISDRLYAMLLAWWTRPIHFTNEFALWKWSGNPPIHSRPKTWRANHNNLFHPGRALCDDLLKGPKTAASVCVHGSWHESLIANRQTRGAANDVNFLKPDK